MIEYCSIARKQEKEQTNKGTKEEQRTKNKKVPKIPSPVPKVTGEGVPNTVRRG